MRAQTFDHIVPTAAGGPSTFDNITILCLRCNYDKADEWWPHLRSLAEEEEAAIPGMRWYATARADNFLRISKVVHEESADEPVDIENARKVLRARFGN